MSAEPTIRTTMRLALVAASSDRLRMTLTAAGSAVATSFLLAAANVALIGSTGRGHQRYRWAVLDQAGLHIGVVVTLLALALPMIAFVGQCLRIGAPARDRRLARLRMAGATRADVARIVTIETALSSGFGAVVAAVGFAVARRVVPNEPDAEGRLTFPTDVAMPLPVHALVVLGIVTLAVASTAVALRRTMIDPFGVAHRHATKAPATAPLTLLAIGLGALVFVQSVVTFFGVHPDSGATVAPLAIGFAAMVACGVGLSFGAAGLTQRAADLWRVRTDRPALLLAAARLYLSPYRISRDLSAVYLAVFVGAAIAQTRTAFLLTTDPADSFYSDTFDALGLAILVGLLFAAAGLLVGAAEGIVERRRSMAMLVASGTPRSTLARSVIAEVLIPLTPGVLIAALCGTLAARGYTGTQVTRGGSIQRELVAVPIPWRELVVLVGSSITVALFVTAVALVFLPPSVATDELRTPA